MSGQLSDFLASHTQRVIDHWVKLAGTTANIGPGRGAAPLLNAVLVALSADDIRPLLAYYELEQPAGLDKRLDQALAHLTLILEATQKTAADEGLDPKERLELANTGNEDIGALQRLVVQSCTSKLAHELSLTSSTSNQRGTSLAITMHELRRPLTILNSYGQLLSSGMLGALPESANVAIEGITSSTEMMVRLVSALTELSRLEDPDDQLATESLTLGEIVVGAMETIGPEARFRDCTIDQDVEHDVAILADRRRLTLALTNILSNALKHSPAGTTVTLRAYGDDAHAHFIVRDQGPGFPEEDAPHLFEKYFRSTEERHRKIPGSGLGLYIVRSVAERHNGTAVARSAPGEGAEFEITLPLPGAKS